ncbi:Zn-dependent hydrolase, glyoxylase [Halovivax ruber XH-70]|uniref:Zn-dependent hydrolase, glyoxylase n=1 Tax=Halovivax ruber (strain DSM 18193 / JCM 13892 / XH-70) TaxID=797302 RepID=L0IEN6_HALRX|nr:rhodanese-like domain-containing protein [Halovivax ruber]AGB17234.1 Zn-dependent hydrolase, glyoxylase [Halovivax ruber XH-70]
MVTTIAPDRLKQLLDDGEEYTLLDTRPEDSYEAWHVRGAQNYPFGPDEAVDGHLEEIEELVGDHDRVVTICAKGLSSGNLATQLAEELDDREVNAVDGGMKAWSGVYDHVEVDIGESARAVQLQRRAKGCLSSVVGCAETGEAVAVDPTEDIDEVKAAAAGSDLTISAVIDTHVHADHVSGGRRLADELDVPYYLGERATARDVEVDFDGLGRNETIEVGELTMKALYTPGHTSEMISILVGDEAVLTADTLHVNSVGRTELEFSDGDGDEGARMLYESIHRTLLSEPESVTVLPGHVTVTGDGEFEVGSPGEPITTSVGDARTGIDVLQLDEEDFVERLADPGEKPANYEDIIEINRGVRDPDPEERTELELGPNNCSA